MAWDVSGAHLYFHYAPPEFAERIAREAKYLVSGRPHQGHGCGLFVTTLAPGSLSDQAMFIRLFAAQPGIGAIDGVVILRNLGFVQVAPQVFFLHAPAGAVIDLTEVLVGYGVRTRTSWTFSPGCHIAR